MAETSLFVATPLHDGSVHYAYVAGALGTMSRFAGRVRFDVQIGSYLPRSRDMLTARFLESGASHMLCVDSDIGWSVADAERLLATGKPFISGAYAKKSAARDIPAKFLDEASAAELIRCEFVPGGFLLLSRWAAQAMWDHYRSSLAYEIGGVSLVGLWMPGNSPDGEDVAFCSKWRAMGNDCWLDQSVKLKHFGDHCYELD